MTMQYMNRRHALYIALSVVVVLLLYCRPREVDLLPQQIYQKQQQSRQQQPLKPSNIIENIDKEKVSHDCKLICNLVQSIGLCSRMWGSTVVCDGVRKESEYNDEFNFYYKISGSS